MEIKDWKQIDGDNTMALDWQLDENSHVWEIGGFEGRWVQQMWDKFHCNITVFEPQLWAVEKMKKRFEGISKIDIRPYGLWIEDCTIAIGDFHTDGASVLKHNRDVETGEFRNYYHEIFFHKSEHIDVCLMNIEGAEYTLIPFITESNAINKIINFWCQFHLLGADDMRHESIFDNMAKTHEMIWNCFPTAVAWRKK